MRTLTPDEDQRGSRRERRCSHPGNRPLGNSTGGGRHYTSLRSAVPSDSLRNVNDPAPSIETPLGLLTLRFSCGDESTDSRAAIASLREKRKRWAWADVGGVRVELLVTPYRWPEKRTDFTLTGSVGAVWRWTALTRMQDVVIEASLPRVGSANNGECLEALDFETPDWQLVVGGPDDDCLGRDVEAAALPASWGGLLRAGEWGSGYGAVNLGPGSLAWRLPALATGESAVHHVAVAWRPNDGIEAQAIGPWLAVDTTARSLLRAAGE